MEDMDSQQDTYLTNKARL